MKLEDVKIGMEVVKSGPKYDILNGRMGDIVEVDNEKQRVRVKWYNMCTWCKVSTVGPTSIPYEIKQVTRKNGCYGRVYVRK